MGKVTADVKVNDDSTTSIAPWEISPDVRLILHWKAKQMDYFELASIAYKVTSHSPRGNELHHFEAKKGYSAAAIMEVDSDEAIVAFRGSVNMRDWIQNAKSWLSPEQHGGRVHRGFQQALDTIWTQITDVLDGLGNKPVSFTGHSLGGAMATIAAGRRRPRFLTTMGAPPVGDHTFNSTIDHKIWFRSVIGRDIVAHHKFSKSYKHGGRLLFFDRQGSEHEFSTFSEIPEKCFVPFEPLPGESRLATKRAIERESSLEEMLAHKLEINSARPLSHNPQIIPWLKANIRRYPPVFLFELAYRLCESNRREAMIWFFIGCMRSRYDAYRCLDKTVRSGINIIKSIAGNVQQAINADLKLARESGEEALEWECYFPLRTSPEWIRAHGIDATLVNLGGMMTEDDEFVSEAKWETIRNDVRNKFAQEIKNIGTART